MSNIVWKDDDIISKIDYNFKHKKKIDFSSLIRLNANSFTISRCFNKINDSSAQKRFLEYYQWFKFRNIKDSKFYIFVMNNKHLIPTSYLLISPDKNDPNHIKWIDMLEVFEDFQGKHLGNQILFYAIDRLKINALDVHKHNEIAIKLYKKFGFKEDCDDCNNPKQVVMRLMN